MKLYGFGPNRGLADPSPFVLKVHTYLRMAGIDYETHNSFGNLQKAPKSKLPFIEDKGRIIADSSFIIEYLQEHYPNNLDNKLTNEQLANAYFLRKTFDESFYWNIVYFRWIHEESWQQVKDMFFGKLFFPLKQIVPIVARKGVKKSIEGHGLGKHNETEILAITKQHLDNFDALLGDKAFFMGDDPTSIDATCYAFLAEAILFDLTTPATIEARKYKRLVDYCDRMHQRYFSENK